MAFDFKKEYQEFYLPKSKPEIVMVPEANYIAVRGTSDPNAESGAYQNIEVKKMMKKRTILCLFTALLLLCGCGGEQSAAPARQPAEIVTEQAAPSLTPEPETPEAAAEQTDQEALRAYEAVMGQSCDVIYNGYHAENDYPFVSSGVVELSSMERAELLQYLGYTLEDISGDGIPELLIGTIPNDNAETPETQILLGGYTCKDGEPVCFLEGWARNVYEWLGGGRFFCFASGGWAYSGFGPFRIAEDGTKLLCEDWYFSDMKDGSDTEIAYYHNQTGVWDKNAAEALTIDADAFWALSDQYSAECRTRKLTPFADYPYTGFIAQPLACKVRVDYYDDVSYQNAYEDAAQYMDAGAVCETKLLLRSSEDVADFRFLSLSLRDVDANGDAAFDIAEVFRLPALRADTPLAVPVDLPETIPFNGFSYTDPDGSTKAYSIGVSGRDGSLVVAPLEASQDAGGTALTADMAFQGVSYYCHEAYDWSVAKDNPDMMYVTPGEETESSYEVIFRSYTGSYVYFRVDKASGEARMTEHVPMLEIEEDAGSINVYDYLRIEP